MEWYYVEGQERRGPLGDEEFQQRVADQTIGPETFVWNPDLPDWQRFASLPARDSSQSQAPVLERCAECGQHQPSDQMIPFGAVYVCGGCKPVFFRRVRQGTVYPVTAPYAGFGIRACAKIIDWVIIGVFQTAIQTAWMIFFPPDFENPLFIIMSGLMGLMGMVLTIGYCTWFIGRFGATPGKMACGLKVVMPDRSGVSYPRALGRAFGELVSGMVLYIGYIMVAFDEQRRALHDFFCDTRVIHI
ncbi:MAG TPA: RDD family protein [Candidatus Hydrogenedentes bacterium]|nr:RDD family protein [Candidatus Hydrogenedentota bacterium]